MVPLSQVVTVEIAKNLHQFDEMLDG